jgi:exonuclease SbcC
MLLTVNKLELQNFLTHRQESLEFPDQGVFLLWGRSGSGKSSLLEAIAFALAGPSATRAKNLDELKHELYPDEDMQVRLTLNLGDGQQVQIFRGTEKGKSTAWIVDGDGDLIEGVQAVKERVSELLGGMDGPTLFATYYSQQGELDALVKMVGHNRRKFVQRMMGVSVLDGVIRKSAKTAEQASQHLKWIESQGEVSLDDLRHNLKQVREHQQLLNLQEDELKIELKTLEDRGKDLREQLLKDEADWEKYRNLTPQLATWQETSYPTLEAENRRLQTELEIVHAAQERLNASVDQTELVSLQAEAELLSHAEGAIQIQDSLGKEQALASQKLASLEAQVKAHIMPESGESVSDLSQAQAELRSEWKRAKEDAGQIPDHIEQDKCPTCLRPIDEHSRELVQAYRIEYKEKIQQKLEELAKSGSNITQRLKRARETEENVQKAQKTLEQLQQRMEQAKEDSQRIAQHLQSSQQASEGADASRLKEIRKRLSQMATVQAQIQADTQLTLGKPKLLEQIEDNEQKRLILKQKIQEHQSDLEGLDLDLEGREKNAVELEQTRERYLELTRQAGNLQAEAQKLWGESERVEATIEHHEQMEAERGEASSQALLYHRLEASLRDFRQYVIGTIRPALEDLCSEHLAELTEGNMPAVSIDEEYNLSIKRHGEFRRISSSSGGEQARAAFALRLALTQLVSQRTETPVGFMVFDEIFGSQDEEHRKAILDGLLHLRGIYPQVFLISHQEDLKDSPLISSILSVPNAESANRISMETR